MRLLQESSRCGRNVKERLGHERMYARERDPVAWYAVLFHKPLEEMVRLKLKGSNPRFGSIDERLAVTAILTV